MCKKVESNFSGCKMHSLKSDEAIAISDFKMKIINHAKNTGNRRQTARDNNINERLVRYWVGEEKSIKEALGNVTNTRTQTSFRVTGGGRKVLYEDMENELFEWVISLRAKHLRVTRESIQDKALAIVGKEMPSDFKASRAEVG